MHRLTEQLQNHGALPEWLLGADSCTCVRLPTAIAAMCGEGYWNRFAVCDLSQSIYKGWCLSAKHLWDSMPRARFAAGRHSSILDPRMCESAADLIRNLSQQLSRGAQAKGSDLQEMMDQAHEVASHMQQHVDEIGAMHHLGQAQHGRGRTFNIYLLLNCFWTCGFLRSDDALRNSVELACRLALPPSAAEALLASWRTQARLVPSKSTMSRLRLKIDVAYMLLTRQRLQALMDDGGHIVYPMVDASPQGGSDYELMLLSMVRRKDLAQMQHDIATLEKMRFLSLEERIQSQSKERELMLNISKGIMWHVAPLVLLGMGKGRSGLPSKFRAVVHTLMLMVGHWRPLEALIKSIHSWVSDYGTEVAIPDVEKILLSEISAYLKDPEPLEHDRELELAPPLVAEAEVDLTADGPEDGAQEEPCADVEGSVSVPGKLHIIHNASRDIGKNMADYDDVIYKLKQVAGMMTGKESGQRLIATCYQGPRGKALAAELSHFDGRI